VTLPYRWHPLGTTSELRPAVGALIAWEHQVYRLVSFTLRPPELWSDEAHARVERMGKSCAPHAVVLRPVDASDDPKDRGRDVHVESRGHYWDVYKDEHYPVCASCSEPLPCRERMAERVSQAAAERMGRYELAGVCPSCGEPVTSRQRSLTFSENLEVLGGPPVTFHVGRYGCRHSAALYEQRWVEADPARRKATLTCRGSVINHNDGTYECTQFGECPGPEAEHNGYTVCRCPDCHAHGPFDCHPGPKAQLVNRQIP
jgi:hypothetical protein